MRRKSQYSNLDLEFQMAEPGLKWNTVLIDLITLATGGIVLLIFLVGVTPTRRGLYCDDESIRYTFHESTIPNWALYIFTFSIPFVVITPTEYLTHRNSRGSRTFLSCTVPIWFTHLYRSLVDFLFGCVTSQLFTDIGKYSIGRLRPNFWAVCQPNITASACDSLAYRNKYVEDYICTKSPDDAKESRVSFPSGHSSFSAYTMLYVAIYIHLKWRVGDRLHLRLLKSAVQLSLLLLAYFTALSRVMDNKHHWSDVAAGALIGVVAASLTVRYVSSLMSSDQHPAEDSKGVYSINAASTSNSHNNRSQGNFDIEAQSLPKTQSVTTEQ